MTIGHVLLVSLLFVLINALFVAAEFALIASPRTTLEQRAAKGDRLARHLVEVLASPERQDRYVATAQLGITLASLGLGMFGEHELATWLTPRIGEIPLLGRAALVTIISLGLLTVVHIVVGEMLPKGLALQHPQGVAHVTHWPMRLTFYALYPVIALLNAVARGCLRLLGVRRSTNAAEQVYTPEELQLIVEESQEGGALPTAAGDIMHELLEFGDLTAGHAMVPRVQVTGIPMEATADELRAIVLRARRTRYPVYEGDLDHIIGMVHARDLLRCVVAGEGVRAADLRRMPVVPESVSLDDVLATMQRAHTHMAIVIDEHGGTAGIVSAEDLFEEVVGEIDEGAPQSPSIVPLGDGRVRAAGTLRLDDLGRHFDLEIEHEDVDSVSGLILQLLGRPPRIGDIVEYGRLRLEVAAVAGRGVKAAVVTLLPETGTEPRTFRSGGSPRERET
jgi:CBS domain containing-hemolysin-like protein